MALRTAHTEGRPDKSLHTLRGAIHLLAVEVIRLRADRDGLQAKLDAVMLEYCPDEMTPYQVENWARHQRRVSPEETAAIQTAIISESSNDL